MSLTSYRAAPPRGDGVLLLGGLVKRRYVDGWSLTGGPGDDLLSHRWACSTMGAQGFHGRVRNGVGWVTLAVITRPSGQGARICGAAIPRGLWRLYPGKGCLVELCSSMVGARSWRGASSIERLGSVSSTPCGASTADLSTSWSTTALERDLVLRWVSRLDAFSGYPVRI